MPLQSQTIAIPLRAGLDTKTDPKALEVGKLSVCENAIFTKIGILSKRHGYDILSRSIEGGGTISSAAALATYVDELVLFDSTNAYTYASATAHWINKGAVVAPKVTQTQVVRNGTYGETDPDVCLVGGIRVVVWKDSRGGVRYSVHDVATGAIYVQDASVATTAAAPKVVAFNGYAVIFYTNSSNIFYKKINAAFPTALSGATTAISDLNTMVGSYDVHTVDTQLFLAYNSSTPARTTVTFINTAWTIAAGTNFAVSSDGSVGLYSDPSQNIYVIANDTTQIKLQIYSFAMFDVSGGSPQLIETISNVTRVAGVYIAGISTILYEVPASPVQFTNLRINTVNGASVGTPASFVRGLGLASKIAQVGSQLYVLATYDTPLQRTYFLLDGSARVCAKVNPSNGGGLRTVDTVSEFPFVVGSTTQLEVAALVATTLQAQNGTLTSLLGTNVSRIDFAPSRPTANLRENLLVAGGIVSSYDGASFVEAGFHVFPEGTTNVTSGSGGNLGTGTYAYQVVYEWTDAKGQVHRSAPSVPISVTFGSGTTNNVTLQIPSYRFTQRTGVRYAIYRTVANGTVYYRISSLSAPNVNDPTGDGLSYVDTASDASITGNEIIYTFGGVLESDPPPAASVIASFKDRLVLAGLPEDANLIAYSQRSQTGEPVSWSNDLRIHVGARGADGGITGLAQLDDKLIIFKASAVYVLNGDGPTNTGDQNDFATPALVTTDAGCVNSQSITSTPNGVFFQSSKGIYQLDRSLTVSYIGEGVEGFNADAITGAAIAPATNQIRMTVADGSALVFDYLFQQWATFTNHEAVDCDVWSDAFVFARSDGRVYVESQSSWTDGPDVPVKLRIVTGWLSFAGLQGYQRARKFAVLGDFKGPHKLRLRVATDYSPVFSQEALIDATSLVDASFWGDGATWGSDDVWGGQFIPYQFEMCIRRQKSEAFRISIEDVQSSLYNEGCALNAITIEVAGKKGIMKIPAVRSF